MNFKTILIKITKIRKHRVIPFSITKGVTKDAPTYPGGGTEPDKGSGNSAAGGRG